MDNSNDKTTKLNERIYLVTQRCDIDSLSKDKQNKDLSNLKSSEERSQKRLSITYGKQNNSTTRAMSSLKLLNPFKGV
jgi:hypothetical protein